MASPMVKLTILKNGYEEWRRLFYLGIGLPEALQATLENERLWAWILLAIPLGVQWMDYQDAPLLAHGGNSGK